MDNVEEMIEQGISNAVGVVVMAIRQDGSTYCQAKETGLVIPLVSANGGNVLTPKEIIATIKTVDKLVAKSKTSRKSKPSSSKRKRTAPANPPVSSDTM